MNKRLILLLLSVLAASLFVGSHAVPSVRAAGFTGTGLVCITTSTIATNCSNAAPSIGPVTVGSTLTVGVFINNSRAMGGFEIYVRSDPTFLSPVSAALGSLIVTPSLTSICVNGSAQTGSCTTNTANGPGVVEVTTVESSGSNECGGVSPCSGMAFTITYSVVGATPSPTSLSYPTAAGCATSSVSSPPNTCVLVDNSLGATLPENLQGASVTFTLPPAVVCIVYPSTATSCPVGAPNIPVAFGSTFTVGVFIQGSQPLAGFDNYIIVDSNYLHPVNSSLGTLIRNPSLTTVCVNGVSVAGACTINSANGNGVVEVSTVESSGSNECAAAPCSGLAFTITFNVVGKTSSTPLSYPTARGCSYTSVVSPPNPPNECVLLADAFGSALPENLQGASVTQTAFSDSTSIIKSCGSPIVVGQLARCMATVTDTNVTAPSPPIGVITWTTDGSGSFNPNVCILSAIGPNYSGCSISYLPTLVGTGTHHLGAIYAGDTVHSGSTGPSFNLTVSKSTARIVTAVIVDQTGLPVPVSGVAAGIPVHDAVVFLGGYPVTGAPGTVTYTLFSNGACTGTGTIVSTVNVGPSDSVQGSAPAVPNPAGSYSFNAVYSGDGNNNVVTSACEPFTVTPAPSLTHLHWTHHLSLSKTSNTQSWTVTVANPLSSAVNVVVRIVGGSAINPSLTFDMTCGVTCVNTVGGVNFTPGLTPVSVAAGATSFSFSFNQPIPNSFANQKATFTVTLYWATGTLYARGDSKSGAFAVVP